MAETSNDRFPFAADSRRAFSDLAEMISLRKQLAEVEIRNDIANTRRLALWGGTAVTLVLVAVSVLAVIVGRRLDQWLEARWALSSGFPWGSFLLAVALGTAGLLTVWVAWRRFQRDFVGLEDSIAELKEDLMWLREFTQRSDDD